MTFEEMDGTPGWPSIPAKEGPMIREGDRVKFTAPHGEVLDRATCVRVWSHADYPLINIAVNIGADAGRPPKLYTSIAHKSAVPGAARNFWEHVE